MTPTTSGSTFLAGRALLMSFNKRIPTTLSISSKFPPLLAPVLQVMPRPGRRAATVFTSLFRLLQVRMQRCGGIRSRIEDVHSWRFEMSALSIVCFFGPTLGLVLFHRLRPRRHDYGQDANRCID